LWGARGVWPKLYDVLEVWRERASNVTGKEMPTGHFIAEEKPDMLLEELNKFLG
jgi:haloacetate dehalogenase